MKKYGHPWHILPEDYQMPQGEIEIKEGQIFIIRFIRSDLKFNLFGLSFPVPDELMYHYVMGVILTAEHRKRMRSTNMIERLNQELLRRSRVIRIFPNESSCLRLFGSMFMEQSEQWETGRKYLDMSLLKTEKQQEWPKLAHAG